MKKIGILLLMAIILLTLLVSCGNKGDNYKDIYDEKKVTVVFNSNGGGSVENAILSVGKSYELPTPAKKGYTFGGWYHGDNLLNVKGMWTIENDVELVAKWTAIRYTINYISIGGYNTNPDSYTIEDEISFKPLVWSDDSSEVEYKFEGWYKDAAYSTPFDKIETGTTGNVDVFAKWTATKVEGEKTSTVVMFNAEGFDCDKTTQTITVGDNYSLPILEMDGYVFKGWMANGSIIQSSGVWTDKSQELFLEPSWLKKIYSITYDFNYGSKNYGNYPERYDIDTDKLIIGIPQRNGYKFIGWQFNDQIEYYWRIDAGSEGDLELTAVWYKAEVEYTFRDDSGVQYVLKDDNTLSVVGYDGINGNVKIPETYNGYKVTEIGEYAFCGYGESIVSDSIDMFVRCEIPKTVKKISIGAFAGCSDLKVQVTKLDITNDDAVIEWKNSVVIETRNDHVLDVILGKRPAIGWDKYWLPIT